MSISAGFSAFLARKNIKPSAKLYFVDAMSAMAMGLFASLLIGTILDTLGDQFHWDWLVTAAGYASSATGIAIAVAIGVSLSAPPLVLYSLCAVGLGSYSVGGPLGAFFAVIVAAELGKAVSRETKVDILVTPTVTILSGLGVGSLIGPGVSLLMNGFLDERLRSTHYSGNSASPVSHGHYRFGVGRYRPNLAHQLRCYLLYPYPHRSGRRRRHGGLLRPNDRLRRHEFCRKWLGRPGRTGTGHIHAANG